MVRDPQDAWRRWCCRRANRVIQWGDRGSPATGKPVHDWHVAQAGGCREGSTMRSPARSCAGIITTWKPCGELQNSSTRWDQRSRDRDSRLWRGRSWFLGGDDATQSKHEQEATLVEFFRLRDPPREHFGGANLQDFVGESRPGLGFVETLNRRSASASTPAISRGVVERPSGV